MAEGRAPAASEETASAGTTGTVLAIMGVALAVRATIVAWTTTMAADGAAFLLMAEHFLRGEFEAGLRSEALQPLHSLLVAMLTVPVRDVEASAYLVSVSASVLTVLPIHRFVSCACGTRVAAWTCWIYALHPVLALEGSEVLNMGLFLLLFMTAVALYDEALREGRWSLFALAGVFAALSYLTRSEGLYLVLFGGVATGIALWRPEPGLAPTWLRRARVLAGAGMAASTLTLLSFPFVLWVHGYTGRWFVTARGAALSTWIELAERPAAPPAAAPSAPDVRPPQAAEAAANPERPEPFLYSTWKKFAKAAYPWLLPFLAVGLILQGREPGRRRRSLALAGMAAVTLLAPIVVSWLVPHRRLSHRYVLLAIVFLLPFMGAGWVWIYDAIRTRLSARFPRFSPLLGPALCLAFAFMLVSKATGPRRAEEAAFPEAGRWLRLQPRTTAEYVLTTSDKISFYGGYREVPLPSSSSSTRWLLRNGDWVPTAGADGSIGDAAKRTTEEFRRVGASFLVLDEDSLRRLPPGLIGELEEAGFELAAAFGEGNPGVIRVRIFRVRTG